MKRAHERDKVRPLPESEFPLEDLLGEKGMVDSLQKLYPEFVEDGKIRCSYCKDYLTNAVVAMHTCSRRKWLVGPVRLYTVSGTQRCKLCKELASTVHKCKGLHTMNYDLSGVWDRRSWDKEPLAGARDRTGHWVVMFKHKGQLHRHHLVVGKSRIAGAGLGAFTVTGTVVRNGGGPMSKCIVGMYTGVTERSASGRISAVALPNGDVLDADKYGSIMVRINSAHGSATNVALIADDTANKMYIVAVAATEPGAELLWDYEAVTDDTDEELIECKCRGKKVTVHIDACGQVYEGRRCPGTIVQYRAKKLA